MTNTKFPPGYYRCRDGKKRELLIERDGWCVMNCFNGAGPFLLKIDRDDSALSFPIAPWQDEPEKITRWLTIHPDAALVWRDEKGLRKTLEAASALHGPLRIACRRITYIPGVAKSEEECVKIGLEKLFREQGVAYGDTNIKSPEHAKQQHKHFIAIFTGMLEAWRIGRVSDTTPEGE